MASGTQARTWAQRVRQDVYYPDTMSRPARRLVGDAADLAHLRSPAGAGLVQRIGPALVAGFEGHVRRQAAELIASTGGQP